MGSYTSRSRPSIREYRLRLLSARIAPNRCLGHGLLGPNELWIQGQASRVGVAGRIAVPSEALGVSTYVYLHTMA